MKKDLLIILLISAVSVFTLKELFKPYFYTSHDGVHQVVRLYYFDRLVREGQIPPRYVPELLYRSGYPLFNFSYHMPWIIAEPIHLFGADIFQSIKSTFLVTYIFSGIAMYLLQKKLFGRLAALAGTAIYLFAPDRFSNIFVRAAIGDATAFIFPPLILLSIHVLTERNRFDWKWIALGAVSLACLLLSHAMVFIFFLLAFSLYSAMRIFRLKTGRRKSLISLFLILFFSAGTSAYYFIPSLIERNFTIFSSVMGAAFIGNTFLTLRELIYSPWGYGMMRATDGGMSFQIGIGQWLAVLLSSAVILYCIFRKKRKLFPDHFSTSVFFLLTFIVTVFLMLPYSYPFWKALSYIAVIDFTWRVLPLTVFSASILAGFMISAIRYRWLIFFFVICLAVYANRNHTRINKIQDWPLSFYLELERSTNDADEYTPVWTHMDLVKLKKERVEFTDNNADINITQDNSRKISFSLNVRKAGKAKINTIYYPGWNVYLNGRPVEVNHVNNGFMEFEVGKGLWNVEARFEETPLRQFSDLLSVFSLLFLGFVSLRFGKK